MAVLQSTFFLGEVTEMKKFILMFVIMTLCVGMVIVATPQNTEAAVAQTYLRKVRGRDGRTRYAPDLRIWIFEDNLLMWRRQMA